jgi:hypothetical protein
MKALKWLGLTVNVVTLPFLYLSPGTVAALIWLTSYLLIVAGFKFEGGKI